MAPMPHVGTGDIINVPGLERTASSCTSSTHKDRDKSKDIKLSPVALLSLRSKKMKGRIQQKKKKRKKR